MKRGVVLILLLLTLAAPACPAQTALLVVGNQKDAKAAALEQRVVAALQSRRKQARLTAQQMPVLIYHVDIPAERKYCEGRLGIRRSDVVFVGLARLAADRLPGEVIDGRGRIESAAAATPYFDRALAVLGRGPLQAASAEAAYTRAAADGDRAMQAREYSTAAVRYGEAASLRPGEWRASARHASALIATQQWDAARKAASRAVDLAPREALPHGLLGLALAGQGKTDEARSKVAQAIALSPLWAVPHAWMAQLALSRRDLDLARKEASGAVQLDPKLALAHYVLGTVYVQRWSLDKAAGHLRSAVTFEPDWPSPQDLLGWAYVLSGRFGPAEATYSRLAQLEPKSSAPYLGLALSRHAAGDDAAAVTWIEKARALAPNDATVMSVYAFILAGLGRGEEALKTAQSAARLDIRNPNAWEALGDALAALKRFSGAVENYEKAEQLLREWPEPELYYKWALACDGAGRRTEAVALARKLLSKYPGSAWTGRTEKLLEAWGQR